MEAGEARVLVKVVGMVGIQEVCEREACAVDCCNGESTFLHMLGGTGSAYHQALRAARHAHVSDVLDHLRRCAHTTSEHSMLSAIGLRVHARELLSGWCGDGCARTVAMPLHALLYREEKELGKGTVRRRPYPSQSCLGRPHVAKARRRHDGAVRDGSGTLVRAHLRGREWPTALIAMEVATAREAEEATDERIALRAVARHEERMRAISPLVALAIDDVSWRGRLQARAL